MTWKSLPSSDRAVQCGAVFLLHWDTELKASKLSSAIRNRIKAPDKKEKLSSIAMLWLEIVMYQAFVLSQIFSLGIFSAPILQRKQQPPFYLLPFSFPSSSQANLFAAHSLICEVPVPAFGAVPSLVPLPCGVSALSRAWTASPLWVLLPLSQWGAVNPFSLRDARIKSPHSSLQV